MTLESSSARLHQAADHLSSQDHKTDAVMHIRSAVSGLESSRPEIMRQVGIEEEANQRATRIDKNLTEIFEDLEALRSIYGKGATNAQLNREGAEMVADRLELAGQRMSDALELTQAADAYGLPGVEHAFTQLVIHFNAMEGAGTIQDMATRQQNNIEQAEETRKGLAQLLGPAKSIATLLVEQTAVIIAAPDEATESLEEREPSKTITSGEWLIEELGQTATTLRKTAHDLSNPA